MTTRHYILIVSVIFLPAMVISDLIARTAIAGETIGGAVANHFLWALRTVPGILFMYSPFIFLALVCGYANKKSRTRSCATIFAVSLAVLLYLMFHGFQGVQHSIIEGKRTAAALSLALPVIYGMLLLGATVIAVAVAMWLDPRGTPSDGTGTL